MSDLPCITCVSGVRGMPCILDVACHPRDEAENYRPAVPAVFNENSVITPKTLDVMQVNTDAPRDTFLDDTSDIDLTAVEKRVLAHMIYGEPQASFGTHTGRVTAEQKRPPLVKCDDIYKQYADTISDGSTASYYQLPAGATELQHLISYRDMNAQIGEIFRACYRYGIASHSDKLRDAKKIRFYAEAEIARLEKQV